MYIMVNGSNRFEKRYLVSHQNFFKVIDLELINPIKYRENLTSTNNDTKTNDTKNRKYKYNC